MKPKYSKEVIFLFIASLVFTFHSLRFQGQPSFDSNISIPFVDGGGSMIGDIVKAGDYYFVYSFDKVIAYSNDGGYAGEVLFNVVNNYGKFNPIYFWEKHFTNSTKLIAYNEVSNVLYTISPDLKIYVINLDPNNFLQIIDDHTPPTPSGEPTLLHFKPLHGNCILKFDKANMRLFWVIDARNNLDGVNNVGEFHVRQRYFFIYDVSQGNIGSQIYADHEYSSGTNYENAGILGLVINQNSNDSDYDFFYLAKINSLELWGIDDSQINIDVDHIHTIKTYEVNQNNYGTNFVKLGIDYIYDINTGIHKIIAFPYQHFNVPIMSNTEIYVLDGNHDRFITNDSWIRTPSPSKKITDMAYLPEYNHVLFSHPSGVESIEPNFTDTHDINIFKVYPSPSSALVFEEGLATDGSHTGQYIKDNDYNIPYAIVPVSSSSAMVCKEDEVCYVNKPGIDEEYETESKKNAENNHFVSGITFDNGKKFVLNAAKNGIEVFNNDLMHLSHNESAYQVNHICMDNNGDKFYLYNKLNYNGAGVQVLHGDQSANINSTNEFVDKPIGDCIYNPFLDHFLISENGLNEDGASHVKIFLNNSINEFYGNISLEDIENSISSQYARTMFISPNGKLYVMADMKCDENIKPTVYIFSATDITYPLLGTYTLDMLNYSSQFHDFYNAHFCYNPHNSKVYATVNPQHHEMIPYNSSSNGFFSYTYSNSGLFLEFDNNTVSKSILLDSPGKIICPNNTGINSQSRYGENMFVIGPIFIYEISPPYEQDNINSTLGHFVDITYSPNQDRLFSLKNDESETPTHRRFSIYSFVYDGQGDLDFNLIYENGGQASCIFANPYNDEVYVHQKTDQHKLGTTPVQLLSWNDDQPADPQVITLDIRSIYPELDHNDDIGFNFNNITTPLVNPFDNLIYLPNGGHSSISKVSFTPREPLLLEEGGWTWLSFPRMIREENNPVWIPAVLNNNIVPNTPPDEYKTGSKLENIHVGDVDIKYSLYTEEDKWNADGDLDEVQSTLGYKLFLDYDDPPDRKILFLEGSMYDHFDPNCSNCPINLTGASTNRYWVGYYYPVSQHISDAIPDEFETRINLIKGQYFSCYVSPHSDGTVQWHCAVNKRRPWVYYGDMVEIFLHEGESINGFYWTTYNNPPNTDNVQETVYYSYSETSDYTPIFIELDTNENPMEIGAFVNDSCIGASTVLPEDSVVLVPAYTDSLIGEIYFEQYYGGAKSNSPPITDYFVENIETKVHEKRMIHTSEKQNYFIVSLLKEPDNPVSNEPVAWISCMPNPLYSYGKLLFYIPEEGMVEINLYSIFGKHHGTLFSGKIAQGKHEKFIEPKDKEGRLLSSGTYIISLQSEEYSAQGNIIIIN